MKGVFVALALATVGIANAQVVVYENLGTTVTAGYSELLSNNPVFGDSLTLASGGQLSTFGASIFNSSSGGNTGSMLTGVLTVRFYDDTTPYGGGTLVDPLLATVNINLDFGSGGLAAGFFTTFTADLTELDITVPQNVLVTQQYTQLTGTSLRSGIALFSDPVVGSSPNTVYINSSATPEGLYTFSNNPGQFGYHLEVVPEPASMAVFGLGALALLRRKRNRR